MVTLNLTLLIELGLFLVFLWVTNKFILKPTLRLLDERESMIGRNEEQTEKDQQEAEQLEHTYSQRLVELHREAEERFRNAQRAAMNGRLNRITTERDAAEAEIAKVREAAAARVNEQRDEVKVLAPKLAEDIARRLGLMEKAS